MKSKRRKGLAMKRNGFSILTVFLFVVLIIEAYVVYRSLDFSFLLRKSYKTTNSFTPTPTPTPIRLIAGKETYRVSQSAHKGPEISQVVFDPLDVHKGEKLTVYATVSDSSTVTEVTATIQTDGGQQGFTFTKTNEKDVWTGTVVPGDTLWYTYILTITAKSSGGTISATVAPRS